LGILIPVVATCIRNQANQSAISSRLTGAKTESRFHHDPIGGHGYGTAAAFLISASMATFAEML
jgi:hypothetical protein